MNEREPSEVSGFMDAVFHDARQTKQREQDAAKGAEDMNPARIASQLAVAMAALVAIRDQRCPDDCDEPGPWTDHYHTERPGIIARNALRAITGKKEKASLWGDGTGGPVHKAPSTLSKARR